MEKAVVANIFLRRFCEYFDFLSKNMTIKHSTYLHQRKISFNWKEINEFIENVSRPF